MTEHEAKQAAYAAHRAALRGDNPTQPASPPSKIRLCAMAPAPAPRLVLIRGTFPDGSTKEARYPELLDAAVTWPEAIALAVVGSEPGSFY